MVYAPGGESLGMKIRRTPSVSPLLSGLFSTCSLLRRASNPANVRFTLLSKPSRRQIEVDVAFLGTEIEDLFVVGYGLDYGEAYRNLPDIRVLEE